jgi:hypothetical protein
MKISGLPGRKDMVVVFNPDDIEKVRLLRNGCWLIDIIKPNQVTWFENKFTILCCGYLFL